MMLTEWGKQLDKSCPLSEYPRPQFMRDSYLSLNGMWQCAFTRDSSVPVQMDTAICVPFSPETPLSGHPLASLTFAAVYTELPGRYRRLFYSYDTALKAKLTNLMGPAGGRTA